jgi:hypothetical protein
MSVIQDPPEAGRRGNVPPPHHGGEGTSSHILLVVLPAVVTVVLGLVAIGTGDYSRQGKSLISLTILLAVLAAVAWVSRSHSHNSGQARFWLASTWITGALAALLVVLLALSTFTGWPLKVTKQDLRGQFDTPDDRAAVASPVTVSGTAEVPDDVALWVLIQPPDNRLYTTHPNPLILDRLGQWEAQGLGVGKGEDSIGRSFTFHLVAVPKGADEIQKGLASKSEGRLSATFDQIPPGAVELDAVRVTLSGVTQSELAGAFVNPRDGSMVPLPMKEDVTGMLTSALPEGHTLWVAQRAADEKVLHPQDVPCSVAGTSFSCPSLYLGVPEDANEYFEVYLWTADDAATQALREYGDRAEAEGYPGVSQPAGAQEAAHITVLRE